MLGTHDMNGPLYPVRVDELGGEDAYADEVVYPVRFCLVVCAAYAYSILNSEEETVADLYIVAHRSTSSGSGRQKSILDNDACMQHPSPQAFNGHRHAFAQHTLSRW